MDILNDIKYAFSDILNFFKNFTDYFRMYIVEPLTNQTRYMFSDVLNFFKNFTDYFRMYIVDPIVSQTRYMFSSVFSFFDNIAYNLNRYIIEPLTSFIKTTFQSLFDFIADFSNILYTSIVEPFLNFFNEFIDNIIKFWTLDLTIINQCITDNQAKVLEHFQITQIVDLTKNITKLFTTSEQLHFYVKFSNIVYCDFKLTDPLTFLFQNENISIKLLFNIYFTFLFINFVIKKIQSEVKV